MASSFSAPSEARRFRLIAERFHAAHVGAPEQVRALLVRLGTHDATGRLTAPYRTAEPLQSAARLAPHRPLLTPPARKGAQD